MKKTFSIYFSGTLLANKSHCLQLKKISLLLILQNHKKKKLVIGRKKISGKKFCGKNKNRTIKRGGSELI